MLHFQTFALSILVVLIPSINAGVINSTPCSAVVQFFELTFEDCSGSNPCKLNAKSVGNGAYWRFVGRKEITVTLIPDTPIGGGYTTMGGTGNSSAYFKAYTCDLTNCPRQGKVVYRFLYKYDFITSSTTFLHKFQITGADDKVQICQEFQVTRR